MERERIADAVGAGWPPAAGSTEASVPVRIRSATVTSTAVIAENVTRSTGGKAGGTVAPVSRCDPSAIRLSRAEAAVTDRTVPRFAEHPYR
jgi:hypothetical protein